MPTPLFALRLPKETTDTLKDLSKVYGSPNMRAFTRELIEAVVSGDQKKLSEFLARLMTKMGEQLALDFTAQVAAKSKKQAKAVKRRAKR